MLTVRHIRRDGTEMLYTCERVFYWPDRGRKEDFGNAGLYLDPFDDSRATSVVVEGGPRLDVAPDSGPTAPQGPACELVIPISRCGGPSDAARPEAFVMNAKGATVARYSM